MPPASAHTMRIYPRPLFLLALSAHVPQGVPKTSHVYPPLPSSAIDPASHCVTKQPLSHQAAAMTHQAALESTSRSHESPSSP
eukprot:1158294-Pelagomonas_calceolata.AAC.5